MDKEKLGSETAKSGFVNEDYVVDEFNKVEKSKYAKKWLTEIGYDVTKITNVDAKTSRKLGLGNIKSDVIVSVNNDEIGISVKKSTASFNQIDKRWADTYQELLEIPDDVVTILKKYAGEEGFQPENFPDCKIEELKDRRRFYINELSEREQKRLLSYLESIKKKIFEMVFRGEGDFSPKFLLVVKYNDKKEIIDSKIVTMDEAIKYYSEGEMTITKNGNIDIGRIHLQRKGGDNGRKTAQMLQFKFSPNEIFDIK
tara:strand:+ start:975 stop:1742 length:768 start_codon:yes stop_codon:yes gene_type:complete